VGKDVVVGGGRGEDVAVPAHGFRRGVGGVADAGHAVGDEGSEDTLDASDDVVIAFHPAGGVAGVDAFEKGGERGEAGGSGGERRGEGIEPGGIDPDRCPGAVVFGEEAVAGRRMDFLGLAEVGDFAMLGEAGKGASVRSDTLSRRPAGVDRAGKDGTGRWRWI